MNTPPENSFHERVVHAAMAGDPELIVSLFTDDAIVMPPNDTTVYGKEELRAWWGDYFQFFKITSSVETERNIEIANGQAFDRASFSVSIMPKDQGALIRDDIRSLTVWRYEPDGVWRITHQMWNSTKPVGSGTNRYMTRALQKKSSRPRR
jgi:ketosteroid isomerase-like protein